tara:strand:- start:315 stop:542 length:228 start_codon:yes stop_codon:yes gene_type:complete
MKFSKDMKMKVTKDNNSSEQKIIILKNKFLSKILFGSINGMIIEVKIEAIKALKRRVNLKPKLIIGISLIILFDA